MKKVLKRILATTLALMMCVGMVATTAFAQTPGTYACPKLKDHVISGNHYVVFVPSGNPATCEQSGKQGHWTCEGPGGPGRKNHNFFDNYGTAGGYPGEWMENKVASYDLSIDALGHDYVYTPNNNGTHNVTCGRTEDTDHNDYSCDYLVEAEACTFENGKCKYCQYECPHPEDSRGNYTEVDGTSHTFVCDVCNNTITEGHTAGTWVTDSNAKCTDEKITQTTTCTKCKAKMTREISGSGNHVLVKTDAQDATCLAEGNKDYWTCSVCRKLFSNAEGTAETTREDVTIAAAGHNFYKKVDAVAATCTTDGNPDYWQCKECKKYFLSDEDNMAADGTDEAPVTRQLGHRFATGWTGKDNDYKHWHKCLNSGCKVKSGEAPHAYNWTPDGNGGYNGVCVCGKTAHSDGAPAHEHVFGTEWKSADGKHFHECTVYPECHEKTDEADHNSNSVVEPAVAATCLNEGKTAKLACSVCGEVTQESAETETDPTNHDSACTTHWENRGVTAGHIQVRTCGAEVGTVAAHNWSGWGPVTAGARTRTCATCGATDSVRVTPENPGPGTTTGTDTENPENPDAGLTDIDDEQAPLAGLPFDLAPTDELTRGLFAEILYWMEGEPETDAEAPFTDVEGHEYAQAIAWGAVNGILLGYEDNTYRPDNGITRGEMELILNRYALHKDSEHVVELEGAEDDVMIWAEAEGILDDFFAALDAEAEPEE